MSNSALSNVIAQTTNAQFQAWVTEVVTALFTTLGVTQTTDTGQINPATATIPSTNTSAGYVIGRFNDTLQSTTPIFFKLEFGSGTATTVPMMWLTVGGGSNGSGTITAGSTAIGTRMAVLNGTTTLSSTSTAFTSRYCYVATAGCGILWISFKYGGVILADLSVSLGGFIIARTNDGSGNATSNGVAVITAGPSASAPSNTASNGVAQYLSAANAATIPGTPANGWESVATNATFIMGLTATLEGTTAFVAPVYTIDPVIRYSGYIATGLVADFAIGSTSSFSIVGSTAITFISAGQIFGSSIGFNGGSNALLRTLVLPWQ